MKNSFDFKKILIDINFSIEDSIKKLNESGKKCLIIVNSKNQLIGTISDGDIRKSLLKDHNINSSVNKIVNKKPFSIFEDKLKFNNLKKIFMALIQVIMVF